MTSTITTGPIFPFDVIKQCIVPLIASFPDALSWMLSCQTIYQYAKSNVAFWNPFLLRMMRERCDLFASQQKNAQEWGQLSGLLRDSYIMWPSQMTRERCGTSGLLQIVKTKRMLREVHMSLPHAILVTENQQVDVPKLIVHDVAVESTTSLFNTGVYKESYATANDHVVEVEYYPDNKRYVSSAIGITQMNTEDMRYQHEFLSGFSMSGTRSLEVNDFMRTGLWEILGPQGFSFSGNFVPAVAQFYRSTEYTICYGGTLRFRGETHQGVKASNTEDNDYYCASITFQFPDLPHPLSLASLVVDLASGKASLSNEQGIHAFFMQDDCW